jgi:hypothetical protein
MDDNKIKYKGYDITIEPDNEPESPRAWDNLGIMVCWHNKYDLGDHKADKPDTDEFGSWDEIAKELRDNYGAVVILPLFLYDHSGITMRTTPYGDKWDSGQVGFIYTTGDKIKENYGVKKITKTTITRVEKTLKAEVGTYDQYLTGDVWGYTITKDKTCEHCGHTEHAMQDSCWGYYGQEDALSEARAIVDSYTKEDA